MSEETIVTEHSDSSPKRLGASDEVPAAAMVQGGECERLLSMLEALSDPVRLEIVGLLSRNGPTCSCDLEAPLARSQPTISHHTKVLGDVGLIVGERRGKWTWWSLNSEVTRQLLGLLGKLLCGYPNAGSGEIEYTDEAGGHATSTPNRRGVSGQWS